MTVKKYMTADALELFAAALFAPEDCIEVRPIPTDDGKNAFWVRAEDLPAQTDRLEALNKDGKNIYCGIVPRKTEGGKKDEHCASGWCIWTDFDLVAPDAAWTQAEEAGLPRPTVMVNSGHGTHLYWTFTSPVDPWTLGRLVGDLAVLLGSDPTVKNPSRIMRLPGFENLKEPPAPCELLFSEPGRRYVFDEFRKWVPDTRAEPLTHALVIQNDHGEIIDRARKYLAAIPGSVLGGRNAAAYTAAAALRRDFNLSEVEAWPLLSGWNVAVNSPPLEEKELHAILQSGFAYGKHPIGSKQAPTPPPPPKIKKADRPALLDLFKAEDRGGRNTVPLPWPKLAKAFPALRPGAVVVIAAPPGNGKSTFVAELAMHVAEQGYDFSYLPLEGERLDAERRFLTRLVGDWRITDDDQHGAKYRIEMLHKYKEPLGRLMKNVSENPRMQETTDGDPMRIPPSKVEDWVREELKKSRVVIVDPLCGIDYLTSKAYLEQSDFMKRIDQMVRKSDSTLVIVAHTAKRPGKDPWLMTGEDVEGSSEIRRLADFVLLLLVHPERENEVHRAQGCREKVTHIRTMNVDKSRFAGGQGLRLAFEMDGPNFREIGILAPKKRSSGFGSGNSATDKAYKD